MSWDLVTYATTLEDGTPGPDIPIYEIPLHSGDLPEYNTVTYTARFAALYHWNNSDSVDYPAHVNLWRDIYKTAARGVNHITAIGDYPRDNSDEYHYGYALNMGAVDGSYRASMANGYPVGGSGRPPAGSPPYWDYVGREGSPMENVQHMRYQMKIPYHYGGDSTSGHINTSGVVDPVPFGDSSFNYSHWHNSYLKDGTWLNPSTMPAAVISTADNRQYLLDFRLHYSYMGSEYLGMTYEERTFLNHPRSAYDRTLVRRLGDDEEQEQESGVMARYQPRVSTSAVGAYVLHKGDVRGFVKDLWESDLIESIRTAFIGDGANTILGLYWFYGVRDQVQTHESGSKAHPVLGNVIYNDIAVDISVTDFVRMDMGSVEIFPYYSSAMDYANTTYTAYIPFVGHVELDPNDIMGEEVTLIYIVNLTDGSATATLSIDGSEEGDGVIYTTTCSYGYDIPIRAESQFSTMARIHNRLSPVLKGETGGSYSVGSLSPNSNIMADFQPKIIIHRQEDLTDNVFHDMAGAPGDMPVTVGEAKGYLQASQVMNMGVIPMRQGKEIERMLQEGIHVR